MEDKGFPTVEFYLDAQGQYRWRRRDKSGDILAASCAGYETEDEAQAAMFQACASLDGVRIMTIGEE